MTMRQDHISDYIQAALKDFDNPQLATDLWHIFREQHFDGFLANFVVSHLCEKYQMTKNELGLALLPVAACYANPTISHFNVGAVVEGDSGHFYFGANQEFCGTAIAQTIHAEQSAISHAWVRGEQRLTNIFINYSPCGHCRQFMNELNTADKLQIHLPKEPSCTLHDYLPNAFGPKDLNISHLLLDPENNGLTYHCTSPVIQAAVDAANQSHAPYSKTYCGVALELNNHKIFQGRYAENAAFNPSLPAMQVALNAIIMQGYEVENIVRAVMVETPVALSYKQSAQAVLSYLGDVELEYIAL